MLLIMCSWINLWVTIIFCMSSIWFVDPHLMKEQHSPQFQNNSFVCCGSQIYVIQMNNDGRLLKRVWEYLLTLKYHHISIHIALINNVINFLQWSCVIVTVLLHVCFISLCLMWCHSIVGWHFLYIMLIYACLTKLSATTRNYFFEYAKDCITFQ